MMWKKKGFWILVVSVICIAAFLSYWTSRGVEAETAVAAKRDVVQYLEDTASVRSLDSQAIYIEGTGKVVGINVDVGDAVKQGDVLLSLDKTDLTLQLKDAEARVDAAKAQLKGTEIINYANKIEMAKSAVEQAGIALDSAKRNLDNAKALYSTNAISKDELARAEDAYKMAAAALNSANLELEETKRGAPESVKQGYSAQLEQAVVLRDTIVRNLEKQEIRAPMDGVVLERLVEKNAYVTPGTKAFELGDTSKLELEANILADDAVRVGVGCDVEIRGKVVGDGMLKGKVKKVAPAAKDMMSTLGVNQKRVPVTIEVTGDPGVLKPGYNVDIKIIIDVKKGVLSVPDSAVFDYKGSDHVFIVQNGKTVLRPVKKGIEGNGLIEILEGLKEGDLVLTKPDNSTKEGMKIKMPSKKG
ncbi:MAG: efflux RND transporter periplasmic adaptor subunit [Clostridiales bacterium]|nr:efflux RND transporter periplasmic adaptor subunit [Eubacteriales bacterium]MDH7567552.1 efflux RND transporter periplasmic adaptor subunit [Clostridiales bacterium]